MDELIKSLYKNITYLNYKILKDTIYIKVASNRESFVCPSCKKESTKIHSRYTKTIQDLRYKIKKLLLF